MASAEDARGRPVVFPLAVLENNIFCFFIVSTPLFFFCLPLSWPSWPLPPLAHTSQVQGFPSLFAAYRGAVVALDGVPRTQEGLEAAVGRMERAAAALESAEEGGGKEGAMGGEVPAVIADSAGMAAALGELSSSSAGMGGRCALALLVLPPREEGSATQGGPDLALEIGPDSALEPSALEAAEKGRDAAALREALADAEAAWAEERRRVRGARLFGQEARAGRLRLPPQTAPRSLSHFAFRATLSPSRPPPCTAAAASGFSWLPPVAR